MCIILHVRVDMPESYTLYNTCNNSYWHCYCNCRQCILPKYTRIIVQYPLNTHKLYTSLTTLRYELDEVCMY